ncbi:NEDD4-binding 2-like 1 [Brachionus plicatilis]|uniref:NEDD4-binding 2-like 1 n=1 Tax=Brachionus plicatilis TaxID=10195 RepID=A0A3M7R1P7_BRAPC|nr:NEDD4-binding 2-like 1 [Brachionus plicatilis]
MENFTEKSFVQPANSEWKTKSRSNFIKKPKASSFANKISTIENEPFVPYNQDHIDLVKSNFNQRIKTLVIMRGASGSGKSTLSKKLKPENFGIIISADSYFINPRTKTYVFDRNKLNDAHLECKIKATNAMKNFVYPIIIDNTNIKIWEFKPYVKLAVQNNYQIVIIEPRTPWHKDVSQLSLKNKHNVDATLIRRTLADFEPLDLPRLIEECHQELKKDCTIKKRLSPTGILDNLNIDTNNWSNNADFNLPSVLSNSMYSLDKKPSPTKADSINFYLNDSIAGSKSTDITTTDSEYFDCKSRDTESQFGSNKSEDDEFKSFSLNETEMPDSPEEISEEIQESLSVLKNMFPNIDQDVILDFLQKYENDLNIVTNILLDSVNFLDIKPEKKADEPQTNLENSKSYQPKSLQEICLIQMEKLELAMENLNSRIQLAKSNAKINVQASSSSNLEHKTELTRSSSVPKDFADSVKSEKKKEDDEPIILLRIDKLRALVDLFGTAEELDNFDENCGIPVDLDLGLKIYQSWKKAYGPRARKISSDNSDYGSQIENDEKIGFELFDSINIRDPIEKVPVFLSEKGVNSAKMSLRQIMAEEMAEQKLKEQFLNSINKKSENDLTFFERLSLRNIMTKSSNQMCEAQASNNDQSEYIANKIKLTQLFEMYSNLVDKKIIEETFKAKK